MALWDPESWDGKEETLPDSVRDYFKNKDVPAEMTGEEKEAAQEAAFEKFLSKKSVASHLDSVRSRVPADKFEAASAKFRNAVEKGGVSIEDASKLYFPVGESQTHELGGKPKVKDPASLQQTPGAGPPPAEGDWSEEKVMEQRKALRKMTFSQALKWRSDPKNAAYLKEELKLAAR